MIVYDKSFAILLMVFKMLRNEYLKRVRPLMRISEKLYEQGRTDQAESFYWAMMDLDHEYDPDLLPALQEQHP